MNKIRVLIFILLIVLLAFPYGSFGNGQKEPAGYEINFFSYSLGSVDERNLSESRCSYTFYVSGGTENLNRIKDIELVFSDSIKDKIIQNSQPSFVFQEGYVEVKGELTFDAKGVSKEQTLDMEPYITSVKVVSEYSVNLPSDG